MQCLVRFCVLECFVESACGEKSDISAFNPKDFVDDCKFLRQTQTHFNSTFPSHHLSFASHYSSYPFRAVLGTLCFRRAIVLQSFAPILIKHSWTSLSASSRSLESVCLIKVGAKLWRIVALQVKSPLYKTDCVKTDEGKRTSVIQWCHRPAQFSSLPIASVQSSQQYGQK